MADDPKAQINPVTETPEVPMPSAEQKTTSTAETQGVQVVEDKLPDETSEHAKQQFERLREQLRSEKEKRLYYENVFSNIQQQQIPSQPKVEAKPEMLPIYDPNTGLINEKAFESQQQQLTEAKRLAIEAREEAKKATQDAQAWRKHESERLQRAEEEEAFKVYPDLDYRNQKTLDKKFHAQVRATLLDSMLNPADYGGKQLSYKLAADMVKGASPQVVEKAKAEGAKQAMENLQPKEQASLEATGNSNRRSDVDLENEEELKRLTRKGGIAAEEAIILRMRKIYGAKQG